MQSLSSFGFHSSSSYAHFSRGLVPYLICTWAHIPFPTFTKSNTCSSLGYLPYTLGFLYTYQNFDSYTLYDIYLFFWRDISPLTFVFLFYFDAFDVPILLGIILDSTVGAEFAHLVVLLDTPERQYKSIRLTHLGSRSDALLDPLSTVIVSFVDHL